MEIYALMELILWIIVVAVLFLYGAFFFIKSFKDESKQFFLCISILFLLIGIQRIFSIIFDFFSPDVLYLFLVNLFLMLAPLSLLYYLERNVLKIRINYLTFASIFLILLYMIAAYVTQFDRILIYFFIIPPLIISLGSIMAIYIYIFKNSSGGVRRSAILIELGILITASFWFIHGQFGRSAVDPQINLVNVVGIISPMGYLVGLALMAIGFFRRD